MIEIFYTHIVISVIFIRIINFYISIPHSKRNIIKSIANKSRNGSVIIPFICFFTFIFINIFGFMIFNDFSARDTQGMEMESGLGPSKSKDFDGANAMGPWIVTIDEFYPDSAVMTVRVNGEVRSIGNSSSMTVKFEDLIAFISTSETLHAGEILGSGTVGGGCGLEAGKLLADGDVIELEVEGIGTLRNTVFAAKQENQV